MSAESTPQSGDLYPLRWVFYGSLIAWLPLVFYSEHFLKFFYFTNEWDMLHDMDVVGYWKWVFQFRAELFIPVFKFLWTAVVLAGDGNYHHLIYAVFINHMIILILLGYLLRQWGFGPFPVLFVQCVLGANYTHIEVFTWTSQWIGLIALTSFLIILIIFSKGYIRGENLNISNLLWVFVFSLLGALSFGRGVVNGAALLGVCLLLFLLRDSRARFLWAPGIAAFVPCLAVSLIIVGWSFMHSANLADSGGQIGDILSFFGYGISLNPWYQQIRGLEIDVLHASGLFILNFSIFAMGAYWAKPSQRPVLYVLILFFLGDAALIALGRNHLPVETIPSWRYQYFSIFVMAPFIGIILSRLIRIIPTVPLRSGVAICVLWFSTEWVFNPWSIYLPSWAESRGVQTRELVLAEDIDPEASTISGYYKITNERAVELAEKYNLH